MSAQAKLMVQGEAAVYPAQTGGRLVRVFDEIVEQITHLERRVFLAYVFVIALLIRLASVFSLRRISDLPGRQEGADGIEFEQLARALAQGRGYVRPNGMPTAFRAPGFPMFVSIIYRITHISVSAATLSFSVLGAAICVITYLLAREVVSERVARLAAMLSVVYFPAIYFSTVWLSEPLFMLSFAMCLYLFLIYLKRGSYGVLAAAGLLFSWSVLVRPFAILALPALVFLDLIYSRRRMITVPLLVLCSLAPTSLWALRNYRLYHAAVLGTNGGSTFYGGNNDTVLHAPHMGGWVSTVRLPGRALVVVQPNEYLHDQVEWQLGKRWVRTHLLEMPLLIGMKLVRFWLPEFDSENRKFAILSVITTLPFVVLWIVGIRTSFKQSNRILPWLVIHLGVAMAVGTGILFWGSPRFRDTVAPLLFIYAACGLERLLTVRAPASEQADHRLAA